MPHSLAKSVHHNFMGMLPDFKQLSLFLYADYFYNFNCHRHLLLVLIFTEVFATLLYNMCRCYGQCVTTIVRDCDQQTFPASTVQCADMYSFDTDEKSALQTYQSVCSAYCKVFDRLCIPFKKGLTSLHHLHCVVTCVSKRL